MDFWSGMYEAAVAGVNHDEPSRRAEIVQLAAFRLGDEEYVIDIMRVRTIIRPIPATPVRMGPKYVEGVITLRGAVVPLIDMRRRFGLEPKRCNQNRIVVLSVEGRILGLAVDAVTDIIRVERSSIRPAPEFFSEAQAPFFLGICPYAGRSLILINVRNIISSHEDIVIPDISKVGEIVAP